MTWWHPQTHADRRPLLLARNRIQAALRAWFTDQGFTEVDPAYLVTSPGNELHLHPVRVEVMDDALTPRRGYLHTSPEFAMKKLLAAGEEKIFTFSRVWRNREGGPRHRVEFTMLEWYRAREPYEVLMEDCAAILTHAADAAGVEHFRFRHTTCDPRTPPRRTTVAEEFARHGIDLLATLPEDGPNADALMEALTTAGIATAPEDTWSDLFPASSPSASNPISTLAPPSSTHTQPLKRPSPAANRRIPASPKGSNFSPVAWSLPTPSGNSPTQPNSARGSRPTWNSANRSMATASR